MVIDRLACRALRFLVRLYITAQTDHIGAKTLPQRLDRRPYALLLLRI